MDPAQITAVNPTQMIPTDLVNQAMGFVNSLTGGGITLDSTQVCFLISLAGFAGIALWSSWMVFDFWAKTKATGWKK